MKILALVLLVLTGLAQVMIWVADVKWRGFYARHRYLDDMPEDAKPRQMQRKWGIIEIWSHRLRNAFGIGSITFGALSL
jgi:hypothetical protein